MLQLAADRDGQGYHAIGLTFSWVKDWRVEQGLISSCLSPNFFEVFHEQDADCGPVVNINPLDFMVCYNYGNNQCLTAA